jgi:hypothetical protein
MTFLNLFAVKSEDIQKMMDRHDIAGLIRALRSSDFAVQTQAAQEIGRASCRERV